MSGPGGGDAGPPEAARTVGAVARGGARSSVLSQVLVQLGSAGATMLLARLLTPGEFGIVALAQSLMGITALISLAGVTAAIVTHVGDVQPKASTYFWVSLLVGTLFAGVLAVGARPLSSALGQADAAPYVVALSLSLPLSFMTLAPEALLQRRLQFHRMNAINVAGSMVYFVLEIVLALLGWGAWAVIAGQVAGAAVSAVLGFVLAGWVPTGLPRLSHIRGDLSLVANMGVGAFLSYVAKNADYWVVSRFLGGAALGVYYIAYVLPTIIRVRLSGIFRQVMLPLMATLTDPREQAEAWTKAMRATLSLALPAMVGIAAVSGPLVGVFFGAQWHGAAVPMKLVTMAGITDLALHAVTTMAIARRHLVSRSTILLGLRAALIAGGAAIVAGLGGDIGAVAATVLVASLITLLVQEAFLARPLGVGLGALGSSTLGLGAACLVMFLAVDGALRTVLASLHPAPQLAIGVLLGVAVYGAVAWLFARESLNESVRQLGRLVRGA